MRKLTKENEALQRELESLKLQVDSSESKVTSVIHRKDMEIMQLQTTIHSLKIKVEDTTKHYNEHYKITASERRKMREEIKRYSGLNLECRGVAVILEGCNPPDFNKILELNALYEGLLNEYPTTSTFI